MSDSVLITGADGYLGRLLTEKYLFNSEKNLILWVHAKDSAAFQSKSAQLVHIYNNHQSRIKIFSGDLRGDSPFMGINPFEVTGIVHAATVNRFDVTELAANEINREGTRKVANFARDCRRLEDLSLISTIYSAGLDSGIIPESTLTPYGRLFANFFERSLCEAEFLLFNEFAQLPWRVFRAPIVIAHDNTGKVVQHNVFHDTIRLFFHGVISLLPGDCTTPIYLSTASSIVDAVYGVLNTHRAAQRVYNVCYRQDSALSWGELIDRVFMNFSSNTEFRKRLISKPLLTDIDTFESSVSVLKGFRGAEVGRFIENIRPFAKQLFAAKDPANDNLLTAYPVYNNEPDLLSLIDNIIQYLMITKWRTTEVNGSGSDSDSAPNTAYSH